LITLGITTLLILITIVAINNFSNYEKQRPAPTSAPESEIGTFTSSMDNARTKMQEELYSEAIKEFETALEVFPNNEEALNGLKEAKKRLEYEK